MIRHVDVRAIDRNLLGAGRVEMHVEHFDDATTEPPRALVHRVAIERAAHDVDERRCTHTRHRTEHT